MWLINLVENLLSVTRIKEGKMNLHIYTELMDEVITEALHHINLKSTEQDVYKRQSVSSLATNSCRHSGNPLFSAFPNPPFSGRRMI